jgi:hypothetical protein
MAQMGADWRRPYRRPFASVCVIRGWAFTRSSIHRLHSDPFRNRAGKLESDLKSQLTAKSLLFVKRFGGCD